MAPVDRVVFVQGGPGFGCREETRILAPLFAREGVHADFWQEPSRRQPGGFAFTPERAFRNALDSLQHCIDTGPQPATLLCHSLGIHLALGVLARGVRISRLIAVAPAMPAFDVLRRVMRLACEDLRMQTPEIAEALQEQIDSTRHFFDPPMRRGLQLAFLDPLLLAHHWQNARALSLYVAGMLEQPDGGFDEEVYFATLADFASLPPPVLDAEARRTPVTVVLGERDPIVDPDAAVAALRSYCSTLDVVTVATAGHAAHMEHPVSIVSLARGLAGAHRGPVLAV